MKRTFTKKPITAAEGQTKGAEAFDEAIDNLSADFDYVVDGLEKLAREGGEGQSQALQLTLEMSSAVKSITDKIASAIAR